jgi:hypothetical protein
LKTPRRAMAANQLLCPNCAQELLFWHL